MTKRRTYIGNRKKKKIFILKRKYRNPKVVKEDDELKLYIRELNTKQFEMAEERKEADLGRGRVKGPYLE